MFLRLLPPRVLRTLPWVGLWLAALPAQADSRISAVTLYPGSATVERVLQLPAGAREAVFDCLPENLLASQIQVQADAGVRVGEISVRQQPRELLGQTCASALDGHIEALEDRLAELAAEVSGLEQVSHYYQGFGNGPVGDSPPSAEQIEATAQALRTGGHNLALRQHQLQRQHEALERELKPLLAERERASSGAAPVSRVRVRVQAAQAGALRLSYQVQGPGWQPAYRATLDTQTNTLQLQRLAEVAQNSGEDWIDVPLNLSTGQPRARSAGPLPTPWRVGLRRTGPDMPLAAAPAPAMEAQMRSKAMVADAVAGSDFDVSVFDGSFATTFVVPQRVNLPSGGDRVTLALDTHMLDTRLLVRSTPALDATAYLVAEIQPPEGIWPDGPVQLYRDGAYVGQGRLELAQLGRSGLGFGPDERVQVRQERPEQNLGKTGLIGSRHQREDNRRYVVENRHQRPVTVQILDAAPVSEHSDVRVESSWQPKPQTERWLDQAGSIAWEFELAPAATQELNARHLISWPKDAQLREH